MRLPGFDFSSRGKARVYGLTAVGTVFCILIAFAFDSFSLETGEWAWGPRPINNFLIPLLLAPPFFYFLLSKLRELSIAHQELMNVAATDSLTSLLNRRAFTALVEGYLRRIDATHGLPNGALLIVDIDHFKVVNDAFGHDIGDEALKIVADTIKKSVRDIDLVARFGGEEFSVFMPGLDAEHTTLVADRLRMAVNEARFEPAMQGHRLSVSVGGTTFQGVTGFEELYRQADRRLYEAKRAGRNRITISPFERAAA